MAYTTVQDLMTLGTAAPQAPDPSPLPAAAAPDLATEQPTLPEDPTALPMPPLPQEIHLAAEGLLLPGDLISAPSAYTVALLWLYPGQPADAALGHNARTKLAAEGYRVKAVALEQSVSVLEQELQEAGALVLVVPFAMAEGTMPSLALWAVGYMVGRRCPVALWPILAEQSASGGAARFQPPPLLARYPVIQVDPTGVLLLYHQPDQAASFAPDDERLEVTPLHRWLQPPDTAFLPYQFTSLLGMSPTPLLPNPAPVVVQPPQPGQATPQQPANPMPQPTAAHAQPVQPVH